MRFKFNHAKRSIWLDTLRNVINICFPELGITERSFNKSDYYLKLANGSEIWVGGLDDKERVEKILGNEYSTVYFNESSQISYDAVQKAKTRLAEKNILSKKAYFDCNPPNKRHWSYWLFERGMDPIQDEPLKHPEYYGSLLMNPTDNLENIDEEYLDLLNSMPEKERNRFLMGLYNDDSDGQAYYAFDRERHVAETTLQTGTLFIGMDFNVNPMTSTIGQFYDNIFYIHDEKFLENSDTYKMSDALLKSGYMGDVIPDSTGKNRKTSGESDFEILESCGFNVLQTHNPYQTDRVNNVNRLLTDNRLIINPKCKKLINDLEKVSWKDNKLNQKTDPMLTHISDCLGYFLYKLEPMSQRRKPQRTVQL